jgi:hypothetical protein
MGRFNLIEINNRIIELAKKIDAPENLLPGLTSTGDGAYIDCYQGDIYYIIKERGNTTFEKVAYDLEGLRDIYLDGLLFTIFDHITYSMVVKSESANKIEEQEYRILRFRKQEELLGALRIEWRDRKEKEHRTLLGN